jgi:hypothetical protein
LSRNEILEALSRNAVAAAEVLHKVNVYAPTSVPSPPEAHFIKMREGIQDKGHEYNGRGPKVLCFGRITSKQMYRERVYKKADQRI